MSVPLLGFRTGCGLWFRLSGAARTQEALSDRRRLGYSIL